MIHNLIPPVIPKPILALALGIHSLDPGCPKRTSTVGQLDDSLLILRGEGLFNDFLDFMLGENSFQGFEDPLGLGDVDSFAPVGDAEGRESLLEFLGGVVVFDPGRYSNGLSVTFNR